MTDKITHYYVFAVKEKSPIPFYECTCGTEAAAKKKVDRIKLKHPDAFYRTDIPEGFKYWY